MVLHTNLTCMKKKWKIILTVLAVLVLLAAGFSYYAYKTIRKSEKINGKRENIPSELAVKDVIMNCRMSDSNFQGVPVSQNLGDIGNIPGFIPIFGNDCKPYKLSMDVPGHAGGLGRTFNYECSADAASGESDMVSGQVIVR